MTNLLTDPAIISERQHRDLTPVFVYGTLRIGEWNYRWAQPAIRSELADCVAEGSIYFVMPDGGYPVAKLDEAGEIIGDVLWFDTSHPEYHSVVEMEIGAGYTMREITVLTPDDEKLVVVSFHFIHTPRGDLIASGDWVAVKGGW